MEVCIGSRRKSMKRQKDPTLKDESRVIIESELASARKELSDMIERNADRLIGKKKKWSVSVPAISGGRPESNRKKF